MGNGTECGKIRYLTRGEAKRAARQKDHRRGRMHAYICRRCGFFHLAGSSTAARLEYFRDPDQQNWPPPKR